MKGRTTSMTPMREGVVTLDRHCSLKAMGRGGKVQDWVPGSGVAHPMSILSDRRVEPLSDSSTAVRKKEA
jgi:hypothetical protein